MADDKPPASEDEAAIAEIQGAAKWMVAALGGIAVVLVGGLTLGNLGELKDGRLAATVVGVAMAAVAIMYLLYLTLDVLVAEPIRLAQLEGQPATRYGATLLAPAATPDELAGEIPGLVAAAQEAYQTWAQSSFPEGSLKHAYYAALRQAEQWANAGKRAVSRERLLQVQAEFKRFRDSVGVMGVFVLGGVALAAWGLTGPKAETLMIA